MYFYPLLYLVCSYLSYILVDAGIVSALGTSHAPEKETTATFRNLCSSQLPELLMLIYWHYAAIWSVYFTYLEDNDATRHVTDTACFQWYTQGDIWDLFWIRKDSQKLSL